MILTNGNLNSSPVTTLLGVTIGSIEGNGIVFIPSVNLTVGTNKSEHDLFRSDRDFGARSAFSKVGTGYTDVGRRSKQ